MWTNQNTHRRPVEVQNATATLGNSLAVSRKLNINLPLEPAIPVRDIYLAEMKSYVHTMISMWPLWVLSTMHNSQKGKTAPMSIRWWINKMWAIYTMEYYLAIKKQYTNICFIMDEPQKTLWEWKKSAAKPHTVWFCLHEVSRKGKSRETESRSALDWNWGWEQESLQTGTRVLSEVKQSKTGWWWLHN